MKINNQIGARIKRLREQLGLSQATFAEQCGWSSQSRIGNYESGARKVSADDAVVMSKVLCVSPAELMFGSDSSCVNIDKDILLKTKLSDREKTLLELFNELSDSEADQLLKTLEEKKQHYNNLLKALLNVEN